MGRAKHGIGGLARRIRPVGRLGVGILPDGHGHLIASGGHLQRQVLHALRFEPDFAGAVSSPVAVSRPSGRPGVLASGNRAEQALELATQPLASSKRGPAQFAPIPALSPGAAPADTRVARAAAVAPGDHGRPIRPRLLTAHAVFEVVYMQDEVDAAVSVAPSAERLWTARIVHSSLEEGLAKMDMAIATY